MTMILEEDAPTAAEMAESIEFFLSEDDEFGAFATVSSIELVLSELDEYDVSTWSYLAPSVEDDNWRNFFFAATVQAYRDLELGQPPSWAKPEALDEPWEPLEPLTAGPGPFDHLNIMVSWEDFSAPSAQ